MPLTDKECPNCGRTLHTDDTLENQCNPITGCGTPLDTKQKGGEE